MKPSIWRSILLRALDVVKPGKDYRKGVLEGFREAYKESGVAEKDIIKINFIRRKRIVQKKVIDKIILARRSMLRGEERSAGKSLGTAIFHIFYVSMPKNVEDSRINKVIQGIGGIHIEDVEATEFINSLGKRIGKLNEISLKDSLKEIIIVISSLIKIVEEKSKLEDRILHEYKRAEKIHMLVYFPSAIVIAIFIIYLAYLLLLPLLAFVSAPVAALIVQLDRKYFRLKRMLKWKGVD